MLRGQATRRPEEQVCATGSLWLTASVLGFKLKVREIAGLVERSKSDLTALEGGVNHGKTRLRFLVNENFYRTRPDIPLDSNPVPIRVGKHRGRLQSGNAAARTTVYYEDSVMDVDLSAGVFG